MHACNLNLLQDRGRRIEKSRIAWGSLMIYQDSIEEKKFFLILKGCRCILSSTGDLSQIPSIEKKIKRGLNLQNVILLRMYILRIILSFPLPFFFGINMKITLEGHPVGCVFKTFGHNVYSFSY